jgi:group I intron endonuclease
MSKKFYVYIITNILSNKQYVGSRMAYKGENVFNDSYMGSSKYLDEDYAVHGIENFKKEILQSDYINKEEMLRGESYYIHKYNTLEPNGYNRYDPIKRIGFHGGMKGKKHTEGVKIKMSKLLMGNKRLLGKKYSEESKEKMSKSQTGRKHPNEVKIKIGLANKISLSGRKLSIEHKENIGKSQIGRKHSEKTREKMSLSAKIGWIKRKSKIK